MEIEKWETELSAPEIWTNAEKARTASTALHLLKARIEEIRKINLKYDDVLTYIELYKETQQDELITEVQREIRILNELIKKTQIKLFLSGIYDANNAIVSIHAGQGGTEACDFTGMLYRMYQRWAERNGFEFRTIDLMPGEGAGYKSVTFSIIGEYAFGYLKSETGVHRIKRISPFGDGARKQTSFSAVDVWPETDEISDIEINPDDLKIDCYRAGGPGGQNVNKVSSAVRITHIPSNIIVQCQTERDQHRNKDSAMRILKARLLARKQEEQERERDSVRPEKRQIGWGSQIRSYAFSPSMVKDHRTGYEASDHMRVLDGDIGQFIEAWLVWSHEIL